MSKGKTLPFHFYYRGAGRTDCHAAAGHLLFPEKVRGVSNRTKKQADACFLYFRGGVGAEGEGIVRVAGGEGGEERVGLLRSAFAKGDDDIEEDEFARGVAEKAVHSDDTGEGERHFTDFVAHL